MPVVQTEDPFGAAASAVASYFTGREQARERRFGEQQQQQAMNLQQAAGAREQSTFQQQQTDRAQLAKVLAGVPKDYDPSPNDDADKSMRKLLAQADYIQRTAFGNPDALKIVSELRQEAATYASGYAAFQRGGLYGAQAQVQPTIAGLNRAKTQDITTIKPKEFQQAQAAKAAALTKTLEEKRDEANIRAQTAAANRDEATARAMMIQSAILQRQLDLQKNSEGFQQQQQARSFKHSDQQLGKRQQFQFNLKRQGDPMRENRRAADLLSKNLMFQMTLPPDEQVFLQQSIDSIGLPQTMAAVQRVASGAPPPPGKQWPITQAQAQMMLPVIQGAK